MEILNIPSPNFSSGRKGYRPEAIVIHIMEGTLNGTDSWFKNPQSKVSAHYGIGKSGEVHRYVQETDTAWHAGRVNAPQWKLIKPAESGGFINPNYYTIGIEHEGKVDSDWTPAMYDASAELVAAICKRWNIPLDRVHIIGHREIYSLKSCPGLKVDMDKLVEMAGQKGASSASADYTPVEGAAVTKTNLNLRSGSPSTTSSPAMTVPKGTTLRFVGYTDTGQNVSGVRRWYKTPEGLWFWGGGVKAGTSKAPEIAAGSGGGTDGAGQENKTKRNASMSTTIMNPYKLKKNGDHIKVSIEIGDAQKGVTILTLGTNTLVSNREGNFTFDVGPDNSIDGQQLYCSTAVTAIRSETKNTSVTFKLDGGSAPFEQTLSKTVESKGDMVFYAATFVLL